MKRVLDVAVRDFYGEQLTLPASSSGPTSFPVRPGFTKVLLEAAAAARVQAAPKIKEVWYYDVSAAVGSRWINLLGGAIGEQLLERQTANATGVPAAGAASGDFLYIGFDFPSRGVHVNIDTGNDAATVLAATYSKSDITFAALTETDGTDSAGDSFKQDGAVTWTVPSDWAKFDLRTALTDRDAPASQLYWVRWAWTNGLDAGTDFFTLSPLHEESGVGGYFKATTEYTFEIDDEVGALEVVAQADSASTINLTWIRR